MTSLRPALPRPLTRIGLVLGGYVVAFALALSAVVLRNAAMTDPMAQASSGMNAFGDAILFVAVFGCVSLLPTGFALLFLRPYRWFWLVLTTLCVLIAATGVAAVALKIAGWEQPPSSTLGIWAGFAVLRILPAPLVASGFLLAGISSPHRPSRLVLFAATAAEVAVCAYALAWLVPLFLESIRRY